MSVEKERKKKKIAARNLQNIWRTPKLIFIFYDSASGRRKGRIHCMEGCQTITLSKAISVNGKTPIHISSCGVFKGLV